MNGLSAPTAALDSRTLTKTLTGLTTMPCRLNYHFQ
jgi:hypothetical protein